MVTTTAPITALFQEAARRAAETIQATDQLEKEVENLSVNLARAAMEAVLPALKLVDKYHKIKVLVASAGEAQEEKEEMIRGITLSIFSKNTAPWILSRDGEVWKPMSSGAPYSSGVKLEALDVLNMLWCMAPGFFHREVGEGALHLFEQLKVIFSEAMLKNETRHAKMAEIMSRLMVVAATINPEQSKT